jgi:LuxR family transcriptional regulator, maltose regulon positive regulatory protein
MQKDSPLIRTKLHLPFTRAGTVFRARLQKRIAQGLCGPLTLITAPAGFGKTTLVASCVANGGLPIAWLSLDKGDNQVERFLNYLVAALQEADNTLGGEAEQLLAAARQAPPETVLTCLINDLDTSSREIILVLDDYQFINSQAIHEKVAFLLDHSPKTFHLVIASRSDPPLPLSRLRARGQIVELRSSDLRFTESEAVLFLNDVMGLHLDEAAIAVLEERTEGWIAGLQMAALSMRDRKDVFGFIQGFSGTHRYILDYLLEEVLAVQPAEIQRFLLNTSILERLTAPLCDAVLAIGEVVDHDLPAGLETPILRTSTSILEYLEWANLFLIPLDDERKWYRYHHLFADLLRARLQQTLNIQEIAALHTRAARWYEKCDLIYDAIHHASLISNMEWVERLIEQNYLEMFRRREIASIRFLTGSLTKEMVYKRPWLCIYEAESQAWFGDLDETDRLLAVAEKHIQSADASSSAQEMLGHLSYIQSRVTAMRGDIRRAIALCIAARENTPASNHALQCGIGVMLGYGYFLDGDFLNAVQTLNETIQSGITEGVISTTIAAYCVLARLYAIQGQLHKAYGVYQGARKYAQVEGSGHRGGTGIVDVGIAGLLYEWNDLDASLVHITQGTQFIPYWLKADDIALAYTTLAQIQQARGNLSAAQESIEKASQVIHASGVFSEARGAVAAAEIGLRLAQGNSLVVSRWSDTLEKDFRASESFRFDNELAYITLARVYIAQKKLDEAIGLLSRLEKNTQSGGRTGRLIEIMILQALAMQKFGEPARALAILAKSLALAEPEGYTRVFLDEGQPLQMLIAQWLDQSRTSPLRDYAMHLLSQFSVEPEVKTAAQENASSSGSLVEPLSQRELEVLHLIATGRTNQEIARQLIVAPGTIKAHTSSIYRKLDVANRTEAVGRARQLGILP